MLSETESGSVMSHNLARHRTTWLGFPGAPGVTTLFWDAATSGPNLTAWNSFLTAIAGRIPTDVTLQSQNTGDVIDDITGAIIGVWTGATQASVPGSGVGAYAAPAGVHINWRTAGIVRGHRVRGRTFLVPILASAYDSDGSLSSSALTTFRTALATFQAAAAPALLVWHRPVGGAGGDSFPVTSADMPDKAAILKSRRD
jgi:hypothetical protein